MKNNKNWQHKHLLGLRNLTADELNCIFDTAQEYVKYAGGTGLKTDDLQGKLVVNLFFEDSTRTRSSFAIAASRLGADLIELTDKASSLSKGETLRDTARNLEAMGIDIVVIRHSAGGTPTLLSQNINACILNAGDGYHEHPTQALLDIFTLRQMRGSLKGMKVAIVGDIAHSRVARSNIWALDTLGAEVYLVGPPTLMPSCINQLPVKVCYDFDEIIDKMDVFNMLRVQSERIKSQVFPSTREYSRLFGLTSGRMARAKKDVIVMHPGPINRGVEIDSSVADGAHSVILKQVTNGVAIRMAVMALCDSAR